MEKKINNDLAIVASHIPGGAIHDTTPLSRFLVPTIFTILPLGHPCCPFRFLHSTLQSFLPLFQQLLGPQSASPSPFLLVLRFPTASSSSLVSASIGNHTLRPTIQIVSWRHTVQGILFSSSPCLLPLLLVASLSYYPFRTLPRIPLVILLHSAGFLYSPKCLLPQ